MRSPRRRWRQSDNRARRGGCGDGLGTISESGRVVWEKLTNSILLICNDCLNFRRVADGFDSRTRYQIWRAFLTLSLHWGRFGDGFRCRFTRLCSTFIAKITGVVVSVFECGAVIVFKLEPPQPAVAAALLALAHARCSIGMMMAADFVVRVGEPLVPCPLHFFRSNEAAPFAMLGNMLYFPLSLHHKFIEVFSILNYCERKAVGCI